MNHSKGKWESTFNSIKERGVRNSGGFICFLPKPSHYSGQDERYERELKENKANAELIARAPELEAQNVELLEALKMWQRCLNEACAIRANNGEGKFLLKTSRATLLAIKNAEENH